jgi:hypothetical protein
MVLQRVLACVSLLAALAVSPAQAEERREYVRVTYYHLGGYMRSNIRTFYGAAACSSGRPGSGALAFPQGTVLELPDGQQFTCLDTGNGDYYWKAWIDIWTPSGRLGYQDYEWVTVVRWGYGEDTEAEEAEDYPTN